MDLEANGSEGGAILGSMKYSKHGIKMGNR